MEFLNLIGQVEAPRGFGSVSDFAPGPPDKLVERMTIGEVLRYQDRIRRMGARSSAIGRYQFIRQTLLEVVRENDVSEEIVFDEEVQTYLARILMDGCGFSIPERTVTRSGTAWQEGGRHSRSFPVRAPGCRPMRVTV